MALNTKITDWANKRVWIVGASTGMGAALATHDSSARRAVAPKTICSRFARAAVSA